MSLSKDLSADLTKDFTAVCSAEFQVDVLGWDAELHKCQFFRSISIVLLCSVN